MEGKRRPLRLAVIAVLLALGVYWSVASAERAADGGYPNGQYLADGEWLKHRLEDGGVVVVDVRTDEYFDDRVIPGAVRMPWTLFRYDRPALGIAGVFAGPEKAQKILGEHGIARNDHVVLYDSVERDGGATASYVFWVLDLLGHRKVRVLERGVDGWVDAGGALSGRPAERKPLLYQAPSEEIRLRRLVQEEFILERLDDPYYRILDVRSRGEYLGEEPNVGLDGRVLKLGHIPTAYNVDYRLNWKDSESKKIKSHSDLRKLYRGLDPSSAAIVYCHTARRASFGYFILRLMGFEDVILYGHSWDGWGNHRFFYPVETEANELSGALPRAGGTGARRPPAQADGGGKQELPESGSGGGYVSCGG
jgi:thiosulfate/3-mercaptopyruvate sulfurtransferase